MTGDPSRFVDGGGGEKLQALFADGQAALPSAVELEALRGAVNGAVAGAGAGAAATVAASKIAAGATGKLLVGAFLVAGAIGGGIFAWGSGEPVTTGNAAPHADAPSVSAGIQEPTSGAGDEATVGVVQVGEGTPFPSVSDDRPREAERARRRLTPARRRAAPPQEALPPPLSLSADEEAPPAPTPSAEVVAPAEDALLRQAQAALSGRPSDALGLVQAHQRHYPRGVLVQERELIGIEALRRLGRIDASRSRARAFLSAYPQSPHSLRLRALLADAAVE